MLFSTQSIDIKRFFVVGRHGNGNYSNAIGRSFWSFYIAFDVYSSKLKNPIFCESTDDYVYDFS